MGISSAVAVPKIGPDIGRFIAARQQSEILGFPGQEVPHPSQILEEHSEPGHRVGELYDVMLRYPMIAGLWEKRWKAVLGLPYELKPGGESETARKIRDQTMRMIDSIRELDITLQHQLEAIPKGVAFDEMTWTRWRSGPLARMWSPLELADRPMWRFGFKQVEDRDVLHVRERDHRLTAVDPARILYFRRGTKDSPWGKPLLDAAYWFYFLGLHAWKYFGVALEKWAAPTPVGKYPRTEDETTNQEAIDTLLDAIYDMQTEYGIAIPEDMNIDLKEAQRGGSVSYEGFITLLDRALALLFLGEVDTSGLAKGPGSFAKSRVSNDVRLETIQMDAGALQRHLTEQLIAPFVVVNYGPGAPVPVWEFDIEEAEPRKERQEATREAAAVVPVPRRHFYAVHQVPEPKPGEPTVGGSAAGAPEQRPAAAPAAPGRPAAAWADQELIA